MANGSAVVWVLGGLGLAAAVLFGASKASAASEGTPAPAGGPPPPPPPPPSKKAPPPPPECSRKFYPARIQGGARKPERIRVIVIHSTESEGSAANPAAWFQNEKAQGSTQVVVGNDGCYRCVDDLRMPAGAQGANEDGLHIEIVGRAKWTREQWLANAGNAIQNAGAVIATWCRQYSIPLVMLDAATLRDPKSRGITTHVAVVAAFKKGSHWDPGPNFPFDVLIEAAKQYA